MPSLIMADAISNASNLNPAALPRTKLSWAPALIFSFYCHLGDIVWLHNLVDNTRFSIVRRHHPRSVEATSEPVGITIPASSNIRYIVSIGNLTYRMMIVQFRVLRQAPSLVNFQSEKPYSKYSPSVETDVMLLNWSPGYCAGAIEPLKKLWPHSLHDSAASCSTGLLQFGQNPNISGMTASNSSTS